MSNKLATANTWHTLLGNGQAGARDAKSYMSAGVRVAARCGPIAREPTRTMAPRPSPTKARFQKGQSFTPRGSRVTAGSKQALHRLFERSERCRDGFVR